MLGYLGRSSECLCHVRNFSFPACLEVARLVRLARLPRLARLVSFVRFVRLG